MNRCDDPTGGSAVLPPVVAGPTLLKSVSPDPRYSATILTFARDLPGANFTGIVVQKLAMCSSPSDLLTLAPLGIGPCLDA